MAIERRDEKRHEPGDDPGWSEAWSLTFFQPDGHLGGVFEMELRPHTGRASFLAALVAIDQPLVLVHDDDAAMPNQGLELRAPGLWAEFMAQDAMTHFTVDLESFAVALGDPNDALGLAFGDRVAFGCELEWVTAGDVDVGRNPWSYELPCEVHGEVLLDDATIEIAGYGWRSHRWGVPRSDDRSAVCGRHADGSWWRAIEQRPMPDLKTVGRVPRRLPFGPEGLLLDQRLARNVEGDVAWLSSEVGGFNPG